MWALQHSWGNTRSCVFVFENSSILKWCYYDCSTSLYLQLGSLMIDWNNPTASFMSRQKICSCWDKCFDIVTFTQRSWNTTHYLWWGFFCLFVFYFGVVTNHMGLWVITNTPLNQPQQICFISLVWHCNISHCSITSSNLIAFGQWCDICTSVSL